MTGNKCIKDVVGYDLNALFTGSEGTLGVITEALLRLTAKPKFARTALVEFASPGGQPPGQSIAILTAGIVPAALELMDETAIACIEEAMHLGLPLDVEAILLIETDGSDEAAVIGEMEAIAGICQECGARQLKGGTKMRQNATNLWQARRSVTAALARKAPNKLGEDITVPRSAIPETIRRLKAISAKYGLPIVILVMPGMATCTPISCSTCATRTNGPRLTKWSRRSSRLLWNLAVRFRGNTAWARSNVRIWSKHLGRFR